MGTTQHSDEQRRDSTRTILRIARYVLAIPLALLCVQAIRVPMSELRARAAMRVAHSATLPKIDVEAVDEADSTAAVSEALEDAELMEMPSLADPSTPDEEATVAASESQDRGAVQGNMQGRIEPVVKVAIANAERFVSGVSSFLSRISSDREADLKKAEEAERRLLETFGELSADWDALFADDGQAGLSVELGAADKLPDDAGDDFTLSLSSALLLQFAEMNQAAATDVANDASDPVVEDSTELESNIGLVLRNPVNSGGPIHFLVDGEVRVLEPGGQLTLSAGATRLIEFHRGGEFGDARFSLADGVHVFTVTPQGWDLRPERESDAAAGQ